MPSAEPEVIGGKGARSALTVYHETAQPHLPTAALKVSGGKERIIAGYFRIELDSLSGRC